MKNGEENLINKIKKRLDSRKASLSISDEIDQEDGK